MFPKILVDNIKYVINVIIKKVINAATITSKYSVSIILFMNFLKKSTSRFKRKSYALPNNIH